VSKYFADVMKRSGVAYFSHADHLDGVHAISGPDGLNAQLIEYSPWGEMSRTQGTLDTSRGFTGQEADAETQLLYYGGRYYDPVLGRFISADLVSGIVEDPQSWNRYSYVENHPTRFTDPTGHCTIIIIPEGVSPTSSDCDDDPLPPRPPSPPPGSAEMSEANLAILSNLLDVVESTSPTLKHVTFYQGGKAYGADLGPFKTPAREDDPRLMSPNFYYDQEDFLRCRQKGKQWHWTALRPESTSGFAVGNPMNLAMVIAVYAAISKELGLPFRFPGSEKAYRVLHQVTSADILAKATIWAGTSNTARNEIFNITNGDYFRWQHMWPRIARMFEMEVADPVPMPLSVYMADKGPVWDAVVRKDELQPIPYEQVASWAFGDAQFHMEFDNITSTIKARRAGFPDCIDTEDMFTEFFDGLRRRRVIPPLDK
jgi:RHS repeat-associated protein